MGVCAPTFSLGTGGGNGAGSWNLGLDSTSFLGSSATAAGPARFWMRSHHRSRLAKCSVCATGKEACEEDSRAAVSRHSVCA